MLLIAVPTSSGRLLLAALSLLYQAGVGQERSIRTKSALAANRMFGSACELAKTVTLSFQEALEQNQAYKYEY